MNTTGEDTTMTVEPTRYHGPAWCQWDPDEHGTDYTVWAPTDEFPEWEGPRGRPDRTGWAANWNNDTSGNHVSGAGSADDAMRRCGFPDAVREAFIAAIEASR